MDTKEQLEKIDSEIKKILNKENTMFFFVPDTKGNPSGSLQYIYRIAMALKKNGFNVEMIHQEPEFKGPFDWLGEEFREIPHKNIEKDNVMISSSDFLFVPEIYSNILTQVDNVLPCKKIIIFQNFDYLTEFMPFSTSFDALGIRYAITTTEEQKKTINEFFPSLNVSVITPGIPSMFCSSSEPKDLIINIVAKNPTDVSKIVKPFYWKYPIYKWVSFKDLRGKTQESFAESLKNSVATIWDDPTSYFGYSAIEAMRSGSIVIGKLPYNKIDWVLGENGELSKDIIWFDNELGLPDIIASVVRSWTLDNVPEEIYRNMDKYKDMFTMREFEKSVVSFADESLNNKRIQEYDDAKRIILASIKENE